MIRIRIASAAALAVLLAVPFVAGCSRSRGEPDAGASQATPVTVRVVRAEGLAGASTLELPGRVRASSEVTIAATISGRVTSLPVGEGGTFRRGDALARFEAPDSRDARTAAHAALAAAAERRDQAVRQQARMDTLLASRVASVREQELALSDRRAADAQYAQALAEDRRIAAGTVITAPFDGAVARKRVDAGADVTPGTPLLDVRSYGSGEIEVSVPESELGRLQGSAASFQVGDGGWNAARLERVDGMTDPATRTRAAYFRPAGPSTGLAPGAFARVRLVPERLGAVPGASARRTAAGGAVISVPSESVVRRGGLAGVYVLRDGRAWLRWLRIGSESAGRTEVLAGLQGGEQLVLHPEDLFDGCPVKVEP